MASFSKAFLYTFANTFLVVVGATTLLVAQERNQQLYYFQHRRFDWKEVALRGVAYGAGLTMLLSGVVQQASMEHILLRQFYDNHSRSTSTSPIVKFAIVWVIGASVGAYYTSGSYKNEDHGDGSSIGISIVDGDDQESNDDGDNGTISFFSCPTGHNSIGAETPADDVSTLQSNDGIIVQNDIMFTIQNVLDSNSGLSTPYTFAPLPEEQTNNDTVEDDNDDDDDNLSIEQQFFDLATDSDKSTSPQ